MLHLVACYERDLLIDLDDIESLPCQASSAAGGDGPEKADFPQVEQQIFCAGKRAHLRKLPGVGFAMESLKLICQFGSYRLSCFAQQRVGK